MDTSDDWKNKIKDTGGWNEFFLQGSWTLRDTMRNSIIWEPLLLYIKRSHLRWLGRLGGDHREDPRQIGKTMPWILPEELEEMSMERHVVAFLLKLLSLWPNFGTSGRSWVINSQLSSKISQFLVTIRCTVSPEFCGLCSVGLAGSSKRS